MPGAVSTPKNVSSLPVFGGGEVRTTMQPVPIVAGRDEKLRLTAPLPEGILTQYKLTRQRTHMLGTYPSFTLLDKDHSFLMAARKRKKSMTSNYLISTDPGHITKESEGVLGKVRAMDMVPLSPGMLFTIYDGGDNPKALKDREQVREELAFIHFGKKPSSNQPLQLQVTLPALHPDGTREVVKPEEHCVWTDLELMSKEPAKHTDRIVTLVAHGAATPEKWSLVQAGCTEDLLQFEKVGQDDFLLSVRHPLSLLQGFGMCLALFDASAGAVYGSTL